MPREAGSVPRSPVRVSACSTSRRGSGVLRGRAASSALRDSNHVVSVRNWGSAGTWMRRYRSQTTAQASMSDSVLRSRSWSRSSSTARRCGRALSRRTAPWPAHRRNARCSCSDSSSGKPSLSTAGRPCDVRTGITREVVPWVGAPSTRNSHSRSWPSVSRGNVSTHRAQSGPRADIARTAAGSSTVTGETGHPANRNAVRGVSVSLRWRRSPDQNFSRSNRSLFITLTQAATKSSTNLSLLSSCA